MNYTIISTQDLQIVNYFINGLYSFEQRAKELEDKEII